MAENLVGKSFDPLKAGVYGEHDTGDGVSGFSNKGNGVYGRSPDGYGVRGNTNNGIGVDGQSLDWLGVHGRTGQSPQYNANDKAAGVCGESISNIGVLGISDNLVGVWGIGRGQSVSSEDAVVGIYAGVYGESHWDGVRGKSTNRDASGVYAENIAGGKGVYGKSLGSDPDEGVGVIGEGNWDGVQGKSTNCKASGVYGENPLGHGVTGRSVNGIAIYGIGGRVAGRFEGDVEVTGDIRLLDADLAEDFTIATMENVEPGTVMVINEVGDLELSRQPYDKRVAGVISNAGNYKPAIILDRQKAYNNRLPISLIGKVYCKVDAQYAAIEVGDLLTTSPTLGHAMKATDSTKAFGAIIGKALKPLGAGTGLIPILVSLQ